MKEDIKDIVDGLVQTCMDPLKEFLITPNPKYPFSVRLIILGRVTSYLFVAYSGALKDYRKAITDEQGIEEYEVKA